MKKIIWLASYPKTGNTWARAFLTNLLHKGDAEAEVNINNMVGAPIASLRQLLEDALCVESSDYTNDELEAMRPDLYRVLASELKTDYRFMKVHDAYTNTMDNEPLVPAEVSIGTVYFIRNPLDVVVSTAHHYNYTMKEAVDNLNDPGHAICKTMNRSLPQLRQRLLSWSVHVESWAKQTAISVHIVRYEDLLSNPLDTFSKMVKFCGLHYSDDEIRLAIEKCSFDKLKKAEQQKGFKEKPLNNKADFFRKGKAGSWREELDEELAAQVINKHKDVMQQYGYLDENNNPVY